MNKDSIIISLLLTIMVLYGIKVGLENRYAVKGSELEALQNEAQEIKTENEYLRTAILQAEALTTIDSKARYEQGFVDGSYYRL